LSIQDKYAAILHESGDGIFRLSTASFFSNKTEVDFDFDFDQGNVFDLDYGDITSNYNAVVVFGLPPVVGIALDVVGVNNNNNQVNYLAFINRDLEGIQQCETVAQNKLLELQRNFVISFKTQFKPEFKIGQTFSMSDNDRYTGDERFIIKKVSWQIKKDAVDATITGYTHSLTLLPEKQVISKTGVADVDTLQLRAKLDDAENEWRANLAD